METIKIAIIGYGFVGKAVAHGFDTDYVEQILIDPILGTSIEQLKDQDITASFICVPTPMGNDGSINSSIVTNTIDYLTENVSGMIILKSTVVPSIIAEINDQENSHRFIYNPEFLTERNANDDFVNPIMHVFGCNNEVAASHIVNLYESYSKCAPCPIHIMTPEEASFVKYGINSFLATKVAWFNQYYELIQKFGMDYETIIKAIGTDDRISKGHTQVPGPDGRFGFGGACFPKDSSALLAMVDRMNNDLSILDSAVAYNNKVRAQYELDSRELAQNVSYKKDVA